MTTKNMAIVSLVCGIVGIVGSFIPYVSYIAPLCAIAGIVFGALALKNVKAGNCEGNEKGLATAGLVLGIVSTAVSVLMFACAIVRLRYLRCMCSSFHPCCRCKQLISVNRALKPCPLWAGLFSFVLLVILEVTCSLVFTYSINI